MKGWRKTKRVVKGCVKGEKGRREGGVEGSAFAQRTHAKPMHMLVPRTARICACIACRALLCMFLSRRSLGFDPARAPPRPVSPTITRTLGRSCGPPARPSAAALPLLQPSDGGDGDVRFAQLPLVRKGSSAAMLQLLDREKDALRPLRGRIP